MRNPFRGGGERNGRSYNSQLAHQRSNSAPRIVHRRASLPEVCLQKLSLLLKRLAPASMPLNADTANRTGLPLKKLKAAAAILVQRGEATIGTDFGGEYVRSI
jgi:hypothetical protein